MLKFKENILKAAVDHPFTMKSADISIRAKLRLAGYNQNDTAEKYHGGFGLNTQ